MSRKPQPSAPALAEAIGRTYDEVPYPAYPLPFTHPERLALIAHLAGMKPAPPERCRVLEIGCGEGANLLPMALALPQSEFVGVDLAGEPIARGNALIAQLGPANIQLIQGDLREIGESYGTFDYIVAHGLYAWVPPDVRDGLMAVSAARLSPQGVALISYNAMPGGHIRRMMREMMRLHVDAIGDPLERSREAKALLGFLAKGAKQLKKDSLYSDLLAFEAARTQLKSDADIFHDDLAAVNEPVYVLHFAEHAARHGLQYLGDAENLEPPESIFSEDVAAALRQLGERSVVLREQYMDFLDVRMFRQTVLCHGGVELDFSFDANRVTSLYVRSNAAPVGEPDAEGAIAYESKERGSLTVKQAFHSVALDVLRAAYPRSLSFPALLDGLIEGLGAEAPSKYKTSLRLAEFVLRTGHAGVFDLTLRPAPVVTEPAERPLVSPLTRLQAARGEVVTSRSHDIVRVQGAGGRALLTLLDGTRDRSQLAEEAGDRALVPEGSEAAAWLDATLRDWGERGLLLA